MAPNSKDARTRLGEPLATEMLAFRAALGLGATEIGVIRDAVRVFIKARTGADKELGQRYETELARLMSARPVRVVARNGEPA